MEKKQLLQGKQRSEDQPCPEHPKARVRLELERKAGVYTTTSERREPQVTWARVHW